MSQLTLVLHVFLHEILAHNKSDFFSFLSEFY